MKIAGSSFEMAFTKYCSSHDIITPIAAKKSSEQRKKVGYNAGQNYTSPYEYRLPHKKIISRSPAKFREHFSAHQIKKYLPKEIWNYYVKISIIRCPYDMLISYYYWARRIPSKRPDSFENYAANSGIDRVIKNYGKLHIHGKLVIDFIIRYECFDEDIKKLENTIGCNGLLESFKNIRAKSHLRPQTEKTSSCAVYAKYPKVKKKLDKALDRNLNCHEALQKHWPSYKAILEDAMDMQQY